jgi:S1-C subfamily serine protease
MSQLPPIDAPPPHPERLPALAKLPASDGALPPLGREPASRTVAGAIPETPSRVLPGRHVVAGATLVLVALVSGAAGGYLASRGGDQPRAAATTTVTQPPTTVVVADTALQDAIAQVEPSMVLIKARDGGGISQGSGVITSPRGLVVTNEHVVGASKRVVIVTADGRSVSGQVVRTNKAQDLAIVRPASVAGRGVALAQEPDADLHLGDSVFAIGSPFGLRNSVTTGIISGLRRGKRDDPQKLIQTDAAINPGNSGGGLFDLRGRLVGIPTSIASPVRGNVGIGFAVPVARVAQLLENAP